MSKPQAKRRRFHRNFPNRFVHVQPRMWNDERFRQLSSGPPTARELYIYLLTGTRRLSVAGVSNTGLATLAEDLGWETTDVKRCFAEMDESGGNGLAIADWGARIVYLTGALKQIENLPNSPQTAVTWRRDINGLAGCELRRRIDRDVQEALRTHAPGLLSYYLTGIGPSTRSTPLGEAHGERFAEAHGEHFTEVHGEAHGGSWPKLTAKRTANVSDQEEEKEKEEDQDMPSAPLGARDGDGGSSATQGLDEREAQDARRSTAGGSARGRPATPRFDFERVYRDHYPRKEGKAKGLELCKQLIRTPDEFAHFEAAVRAYAEQCRGKEQQYTAHFSTWVNRKRWRDFPPTTSGPSTSTGAGTDALPPMEPMPNGQPWPAEIQRVLARLPLEEQRRQIAHLRGSDPWRFDPDGSAKF